MPGRPILIVGGGAAGVFAAIACAEAAPGSRVVVLERGPACLAKVRISGGGRCNVTHACFDPQSFITHYPRGGQALLTPFRTFSAQDTVRWFQHRGVTLKTEPDRRMFPDTDSSQTIVQCLLRAARSAHVELRLQHAVQTITRLPAGGFELQIEAPRENPSHPHPKSVQTWTADQVLLATGGCRGTAAGALAASLGHSLIPPVPSLFAFDIDSPGLGQLAGISLDHVALSVPAIRRCEEGPLLITHRGLSGPAVLRLSAWGARELSQLDYRFPLLVSWLPNQTLETITASLKALRTTHPARHVANSPLPPLPSRLWEFLVRAAGLPPDQRWSNLARAQTHALAQQLHRTSFAVLGKSLNQDEFVTCGGVRLAEVDFRTMESRLVPGLYAAGELLDIDGLTGGFNFQAAWSTGYVAGQAMASAHRQGLSTGRNTSLR